MAVGKHWVEGKEVKIAIFILAIIAIGLILMFVFHDSINNWSNSIHNKIRYNYGS